MQFAVQRAIYPQSWLSLIDCTHFFPCFQVNFRYWCQWRRNTPIIHDRHDLHYVRLRNKNDMICVCYWAGPLYLKMKRLTRQYHAMSPGVWTRWPTIIFLSRGGDSLLKWQLKRQETWTGTWSNYLCNTQHYCFEGTVSPTEKGGKEGEAGNGGQAKQKTRYSLSHLIPDSVSFF